MKRLNPLLTLAIVLTSACLCGGQERGNRQRADRGLPAVLRNVELSEAQRAKVDKTRKQFREKLDELQQKRNEIYTPEQQRARREAVRKARETGKTNAEMQKVVDEAIQLTAKQKKHVETIAMERKEIDKSMQATYLGILTPQQRKSIGQRNRSGGGNRIAPTHTDVAYGPHERNVMDVWIAKSDKPTPVFFSIHGGGFRNGNKSVDAGLLKACLDQGISVVAITYRLSGDAIAPAQFHDSARAVQFVRSKSDQWNMDKTRFASSGGSAGAGLSLWLAFHDDMADPNNSDPVLLESTRLSCAVVYNGQTTYDPRVILELIPEADTSKETALELLYDVDLSKGPGGIPPGKFKLIEEVSPVTHLSRDDVPVLLAYSSDIDTKITSRGIGIHHPRFGEFLKKKMDSLGIECLVETNVKRGSKEWVQQTVEFLKKHL